MRSVTWANLKAHKLRVLLVSVVVMLGVAFVAGSFVLTATINKSFSDLFATVYEDVDVVVRGDTSADELGAASSRPPLEASVLDQVRSVEGVESAEGYTEGFAQLLDREGDLLGGGGGAPSFGGSWVDNDAVNPFSIAEGRAPNGPNEVVIDGLSASRGNYGPGDSADVVSADGLATFQIVGVSRFGDVDSPGGASYLLFSAQRSAELFGFDNEFSEINAVAAPGVDQNQLRQAVADVVASDLEVQTGAEVAEETQQSFAVITTFMNTVLLIFAGISLFVGAFVISNVFSILVAQRTKELALLRALGATSRQVKRSVKIEGFVVGLIAGVLGLVVGIGLAGLMLRALAAVGIEVVSTSLVIEPVAIIVSLVAGVVITVLASLMPARRAAKVPPLAAMRDVAVERTTATRKRIATGAALLTLGVVATALGLLAEVPGWIIAIGCLAFFLGVFALSPVIVGPFLRVIGTPVARLRNVSGRLAQENSIRNPRRTASTAGALVIGVSLVVVCTVVITSFRDTVTDTVERSFAGDFVVASQQAALGGISVSIEDELESLPGVETIVPQRFTSLAVNDGQVFANAVDADAVEAIYNLGVTNGSITNMGATSLAVSNDVATSEGWQVGDTVEVRFPQTELQTFELVATYDETDVFGAYIVDLDAYDANVQERFNFSVFIKLAEDASASETEAQINQVLEGYPNAQLQDLAGIKESVSSQVNQVLNILYGLLALAVVVALLGIASTLALSVFERTHEIGLLRAVGMSRRQVRSMIRWESILMALFGTLLGLLVGMALSWVAVTALDGQGIDQFSIPWDRLAVMVLLAVLAGLAAAIWPARRAARLNVLKAIATD